MSTVRSIHRYNPVLYHECLLPEVFHWYNTVSYHEYFNEYALVLHLHLGECNELPCFLPCLGTRKMN